MRRPGACPQGLSGDRFHVFRKSGRGLPLGLGEVLGYVPATPRPVEMGVDVPEIDPEPGLAIFRIGLHLTDQRTEMLVGIRQVGEQMGPSDRTRSAIDHVHLPDVLPWDPGTPSAADCLRRRLVRPCLHRDGTSIVPYRIRLAERRVTGPQYPSIQAILDQGNGIDGEPHHHDR